eukprot:868579-Amphidinium_carterae.1
MLLGLYAHLRAPSARRDSTNRPKHPTNSATPANGEAHLKGPLAGTPKSHLLSDYQPNTEDADCYGGPGTEAQECPTETPPPLPGSKVVTDACASDESTTRQRLNLLLCRTP